MPKRPPRRQLDCNDPTYRRQLAERVRNEYADSPNELARRLDEIASPSRNDLKRHHGCRLLLRFYTTAPSAPADGTWLGYHDSKTCPICLRVLTTDGDRG